MTYLKLIPIFLVACGGCSSEEEAEVVFDSGTTPMEQGTVDLPAPAPDHQPALITVTPAADARNIQVQSSISLVFPEALDEASLSLLTVSLRHPGLFETISPVDGGQALPCRLSYAAADQTLTIDPLGALLYGTTYRVETAGLKYSSGAEITFSSHFTTIRNPITKTETYGGEDQITSYELLEATPEGLETHQIFYLPGPDGVALNTDDEIDRYRAFTWDQGLHTRGVSHAATGDDGKWLSTDDPPAAYEQYKLLPDGRIDELVSYSGSGLDGIWFNTDDQVQRYIRVTFDEGNRAEVTQYSDPGLDLTWFTIDDKIFAQGTYGYDERGMRNEYKVLVNAIIGDSTESLSLYALNDDGQVVRMVSYVDPGLDLEWKTADDVTDSYRLFSYTAAGLIDKEVTYVDPGVDLEWLTQDDVIKNYYTFTHDERGNQTKRIKFDGSGADGTWATIDDIINRYIVTTYDAQDNRVLQQSFASDGADNLWFTSDDRLARATYYQALN